MIELEEINNSKPYQIFEELYKNALMKGQKSIEAITISSFNKLNNEVESRYVNLKYINGVSWIFFTNYNSQKAQDFSTHDQISALFYWNSINTQIRMKAKVKKCPTLLSNQHFEKRSKEKNALAISSAQSKIIKSYEEVEDNYKKIMNSDLSLKKRPSYWGGYSFTPYYFEFWEGHESRINRRKIYEYVNSSWQNFILEP